LIIQESRFVDINELSNYDFPVQGQVSILGIDKMFYHAVFTVVFHFIQPFPELISPAEICWTGGYDLDKGESLLQ